MNEQIHELNKEHRNIDRSTDVLSFPLGEDGDFDMNHETGAYLLGDIVISLKLLTVRLRYMVTLLKER